ncbi:hypothetical protein NM688_g8929 [Phlebia brevispora]|uniref:Uncharacterized protein n=1 Tax=Phlebia brevispora TaxID=194682 RepID=A0ACC1RLE2_9APHY|nr:hypothetical protein NM688_g8929 [Phlebia brevispora]
MHGTTNMTVPKLFSPIQVGTVTLNHRVVLAPLTRFRAFPNHVHNAELAKVYYAQRASVPGTLLITEGVFPAAEAGGYPNVPGIWSDEQVAAWKKIVDAVHAKGSFIFMQLWGLGRGASPEACKAEGFDYISASDIKRSDRDVAPRALTTDEVKKFVQLYATAAYNAVHRAGFDGVEIHGANGYLVDQFIQDVSNKRTDEYGGSIENRSRFALEIVDAVAAKVGAERTAIRISPWGRTGGMRMADPIPQFGHLVKELAQGHPSLAYIHVVEPRVSGQEDREVLEGESNDFIRDIWRPRPLISAGGYTRELAIEVAEKKGDLIAFGRLFISNPDLPFRLLKGIPAVKGNRSSYYTEGPAGYTDYPTAQEAGLTTQVHG